MTWTIETETSSVLIEAIENWLDNLHEFWNGQRWVASAYQDDPSRFANDYDDA